MMKMISMKFLYLPLFLGVVTCSKLPSTFKRCKHGDQVCLKDAIQDGIPKFAKGFKSLGVHGIDPLSIPFMEIPGGTGAVKISQKVTDGHLYGLSTAVLDNLQFDTDHGKIQWSFHCPNLTIKANYEMSGQIMVLPVQGKGKMEVVIENAKGNEKINFSTFEKDNEKYMKVGETELKLEAGHVTFNLENVFDGNKQLSDQINQVMNDNWSVVFDEIKDGYNDAIRILMDSIVNDFFSEVSMSEIFLD